MSLIALLLVSMVYAAEGEAAPTTTCGNGEVLKADRCITLPVRVKYVVPEAPKRAVLSRQSGTVELQAVIQKDGNVSRVKVLKCNRPGIGFEEAAIKAVSKWKYKPATEHGKPVAIYFTIKVDFKM